MGGCYLLYMGVKSLKSGINNLNSRAIMSQNEKSNTKDEVKVLTSYVDDFMTQILNPKVSIFYIAAFPKSCLLVVALKQDLNL